MNEPEPVPVPDCSSVLNYNVLWNSGTGSGTGSFTIYLHFMSTYHILLFLFAAFNLFGSCKDDRYCIAFVHIGNQIPKYLKIAVSQARLFNPDCPIYLIINSQAVEQVQNDSTITIITCESLPLTVEHQSFNARSKHNTSIMDGYWRFTSERFLYLNDFINAYDIKNVFHLENDVMLYTELKPLLPIFLTFYPGIAATFEGEGICIPGFVYISQPAVMAKLAAFFADQASKSMSDMKLLSLFKHKNRTEVIDRLPTIMERYIQEQTPASFENRLIGKRMCYCNHIDHFKSIFDASAIGVFLGGMDPLKSAKPPGHVVVGPFDSSLLTFEWHCDHKGRKIPYAVYADEKYKINNLHIASKDLESFKSIP